MLLRLLEEGFHDLQGMIPLVKDQTLFFGMLVIVADAQIDAAHLFAQHHDVGARVSARIFIARLLLNKAQKCIAYGQIVDLVVDTALRSS